MDAVDPVVLVPGSVFNGRYLIARCLGIGGMGAIYEVVHLQTERVLALKVILPDGREDPDLRARFAQEARVTAAIESEHIIEILDAGVDDATGLPFLVMKLLRGEDLGAVLSRRGRLAADETVILLRQVASALVLVHDSRIVHRDLKPENLFLTMRDGSPHVIVLDFGIAKVLNCTAETTRVMGSYLYMAPEQWEGDKTIGPPADLYALGHIAYTLLVGCAYWSPEARIGFGRMFRGVAGGMIEPATARALAVGVTLPDEFDNWFAKATAMAPEARFRSAAELVAALAEALAKAPPSPEEARTEHQTTSEQGPSSSTQQAAPKLVELYRDDCMVLLADPHGPMTRLVRSATPHPSASELERSFEGVIAVLDRLGRTGRVMLCDMRQGPGRNDPAFEAIMLEIRPRLYQGLDRIGVLMRTAVGTLQIQRLVQDDGIERFASTDEAEILEFLRGESRERPR